MVEGKERKKYTCGQFKKKSNSLQDRSVKSDVSSDESSAAPYQQVSFSQKASLEAHTDPLCHKGL